MIFFSMRAGVVARRCSHIICFVLHLRCCSYLYAFSCTIFMTLFPISPRNRRCDTASAQRSIPALPNPAGPNRNRWIAKVTWYYRFCSGTDTGRTCPAHRCIVMVIAGIDRQLQNAIPTTWGNHSSELSRHPRPCLVINCFTP